MQALRMKYIGYNQHDAETWYRCPKCKKEYGGWMLHHIKQESPDVESIVCDCGELLMLPK